MLVPNDRRTLENSGVNTSASFFVALQIICGFVMVIIAVFRIIPSDLTTTAKFFDGLNLQVVMSGRGKFITSVGVEAESFSFALFFINIAMSIRAATCGNWAKNAVSFIDILKMRHLGIVINEFNYQKMWITVMYIIGMAFDTLTDTDYRAFYGDHGFQFWLKALIVSFAYYSVMSEFALIQGSQLVWGGILKTFGTPAVQQQKQNHGGNKQVHNQQKQHNNNGHQGNRQERIGERLGEISRNENNNR